MPRTHRTYDPDFHQEAVNLLLSSGRPLKRVATELGISANSLRTWRDRALSNGRVAEAASPPAKGRSEAPIADAAGEIRRLQREVEYLRRQRESSGARWTAEGSPKGAHGGAHQILKKAMSILSEEPQSGMR